MSAIWLILGGIVIFLIAYTMYGAWLAKQWGIDPNRKTPAHTRRDDIDYCPAKAPVLLGHHFASIAGAGPITGPILASVFGWIPVALWIIVGSIFVGGVHDFGALFASIRHDGKSIGEIIEANIGKSGKKLFAVFAWLTLVLVVAAFLSITASTFVSVPAAGTSSLLFIVLAVIFGFVVYRKNAPLSVSTVAGVALLLICVWLGQVFPLKMSLAAWIYLLIVYIFAASVLPVWMLLQPRDYLNSYLLYAMIAGAVIGIFAMNPTIQLAPFTGFYVSKQYLFPMLFVTVACGAISGFHSLVGSGTTSKQLDNEKDAKIVGYGSMLIEGVLALIALTTAAYVAGPKLAELLKAGGPINVFSDGVGTFLTVIGMDFAVGKQFAALALSAFALTSLDTATRLGRFIFQEFFSEAGQQDSILTNRFVSTTITVAAGGFLAFNGYAKVWPLFGSANQLLAALALIAVAVYLKKIGKNNKMFTIPTAFMFAVTLTALYFLVKANMAASNFILVGFGIALFILAVILLIQAWKVLADKNTGDPNLKA
ncbi:MAG: carbon starvation protein CstA [Peptococcaceae bacterium]|jgi:carbon starvation protein|uniref:Carbon starvation protein A n=1 Tax=Thermanaerosceptrum fracticalcis TaxID=1712410 RepID=A0A7G6E2P6_THEFR|nr:carbon starvation protein A [Thermanaerosceptrum fracticalcis]MBZ4653923.1 carbon starvation protein CstA [Peptococcaceae bacterium]QNB46350.1 carbon starvation protein A [Thermanaerosceptrum fracticalcis]